MKVYEIILDGASKDWITTKPEDFEDEIIDMYRFEHNRNIPKGKLIKIMNAIRNMDIGDNIEFNDIKLRFYCYEQY